jgi:hypothetical protein
MQTLPDFLSRIKGIEYLLAIILIALFYVVWQLLHYKGKLAGLALRLAPATIFILIIGILAFSSITSPQPRPTPISNAGTPLLSVEVLTKMYGPAWLNHDLHKAKVGNCKICHHFSGDSIKQCRDCHGEAFNPIDPNKPGLAHIYHLRCISCHKENRSGPTQCEGCHTKASIPPLTSFHPLTQIQKCLDCHGPDGIAGVKKIPPDHSGIPGSVCQLCHKPPLESAIKAMCRIPHDTNRTNCLACHGKGIAGAAKIPATHSGRTNETCMLCHRAEGE